MDPVLRGLLYGLVTNAGILLMSFLTFLYVRWLRGDRNRGTVPMAHSSSAPLIGPVPPGFSHKRTAGNNHVRSQLPMADGGMASSAARRRRTSLASGRSASVSFLDDLHDDDNEAAPGGRHGYHRPMLYRTFTIDQTSHPACGFVGTLWEFPVDQFFSMDIQFYLRFLKSAGQLSWILSVLGLCIVLPINLTAPGVRGTKQQTWLERASSANITAHGWRIWALYVMTWVYSAVVYYFVYVFWRRLWQYRWAPADHFTAEKFALIVRGIRRSCVDSTVLRQHFEALKPTKVISAHIILDYSAVADAEAKLLAKHELERLATQQERFADDKELYQSGRAILDYERSTVGASDFPETGSEFASLERQLLPQREFGNRALAPTRGTGVGFVTFRSTAAAAECLCDPRVLGVNYDWDVERAPPPGDIIWANVHIPAHTCFIRTLFLNSLLFIFSIVLTSSALLTDWLIPLMENFEKAIHEADVLKLTVSGWGAPLVLFIVNSVILPWCVWWSATCSGHFRESSQAAAVLHGNAIFLVLNSLIFPIVGTGSVWAVVDWMYHTEIQRWNIQLSVLIVTQSGSYAIKYLLNACFLSSSAQLLQLPQLVYRKCCHWMGKAPDAWPFDFGYHYAFCTSIFTLCFVLSVFLPLVLPLTALFFFFKYWLDKYNFAFTVWDVDVDSAGAVTQTALNYFVFAVTFMQFVMSGYFLKFGLGTDRYLTLAGTLLFIASSVGAILQLGQFVNIGSFVRDWKPGIARREWHARGPELEVLKLAYVHPLEKPLTLSKRFSDAGWRLRTDEDLARSAGRQVV